MILRDLALALAVGLAAGLAVLLLFSVLGGIIGGGFYPGVSAGRSAVLIAGAACLIFAAGLLLKGGNLPESAFRFRLKKRSEDDFAPPEPLRLYKIVPRTYTALMTAAGILLVSVIPDLILMRLS